MGKLMLNDRPYSGGKPTHIYSTDEQKVGVWIDGSTIYEITYELTNSIIIDNYNWTTTPILVDDKAKVIDCWAMNVGGTYWGDICVALDINSYINLKCSRNGDTIAVKWFTIQYTKST